MRGAVVDIGTNSTRLLIGEVDADGRIEELVRRSRVTRLGAGVDSAGRLSPEACARVYAVLDDYRAEIDAHAPTANAGTNPTSASTDPTSASTDPTSASTNPTSAGASAYPNLAVMTSAVRDAANGRELADHIRREYGLDARILSGDEEARMTFLGAMSGQPAGRRDGAARPGGRQSPDGEGGHPAPASGATGHPAPISGATGHPAPASGATSHPAPISGVTGHPAPARAATSHPAPAPSATGQETPAQAATSHPAPAPSATGQEAPAGAANGQTVVIDIGGGSTEFVVGSDGRAGFHASLHAGVVRMSERHIASDPPAPRELQAMAADTRAVYLAGLPESERRSVVRGIAVAGTATSAASIDQELDPYDPARVHGYRLLLATVEMLLARLADMDEAQRRCVVGLDPDRAPTIVAGMVLLSEAMRAFGLQEVEVSEHDILHGGLLTLAQRC